MYQVSERWSQARVKLGLEMYAVLRLKFGGHSRNCKYAEIRRICQARFQFILFSILKGPSFSTY